MHPFIAVLAAVALLAAGCSGGPAPDGDGEGDADTDAHGDADGDADGDGDGGRDADPDPWVPPDGGALTPEEVPNCGDGVVDPGEQCDDGNRLNGDGCDWLCRIGDGEPPPEADPTVPEYVPAAEAVPVDDLATPVRTEQCPPLTWSGGEFATAYHSYADYRLHFRRFDEEGRGLESDWTDPFAPTDGETSCDLVWDGRGYGLFYAEERAGLRFLRLDNRGKPMGAPVLVESGMGIHDPAADVTPGGFVVAWGRCEDSLNRVTVLLLDEEGSADGLPEPLVVAEPTDSCGARNDLASGPGGFGLNVAGPGDTARFLHVSEDLSEVVTSGTIGGGYPGDVLWAGGSYVTTVDHRDTDRAYLDTCVLRFSASGMLEGPPVCNRMVDTFHMALASARLAAGDLGLALVFRIDRAQRLVFVRTDSVGVPVGAPQVVYDAAEHPTPFSEVDSVATVWADDGFAILFSYANGPLMLRRFVRAAP